MKVQLDSTYLFRSPRRRGLAAATMEPAPRPPAHRIRRSSPTTTCSSSARRGGIFSAPSWSRPGEGAGPIRPFARRRSGCATCSIVPEGSPPRPTQGESSSIGLTTAAGRPHRHAPLDSRAKSRRDSVESRQSFERVGIDLRACSETRSTATTSSSQRRLDLHPRVQPGHHGPGAVNSPGAVAYTPATESGLVRERGGGYTQAGDNQHPYVTQPDGEREGVSGVRSSPTNVPVRQGLERWCLCPPGLRSRPRAT